MAAENNMKNKSKATKSQSQIMLVRNQLVAVGPMRLFAILSVLVLIAAQLAASNTVPQQQTQLEQSQPGNYNNLVENLISDLMQDAGDRLKKSKANGYKTIKSTLRFGRRSDPWLVAPTIEEQLALDELNNRRLFSE